MIQVDNDRAMHTTEQLAVKALLKVIEREVHKVRRLVCMYCDVIAGGDEARNVFNPQVNDWSAPQK